MSKVFLFATLLLMMSCNIIDHKKERGNGNVTEQKRSVQDFKSISVSTAIDVTLRQDSATSVVVKTDENLQHLVEVYIEGEQLFVELEDNARIDATGPIKVFISAPVLDAVEVSGASEVKGETKITAANTFRVSVSGASKVDMELDAPEVKTDVSGASSVTLRGRTRDFVAESAGASKFHCFDLMAENTTVDITGASKAEVFASVKLDVTTSGASSVVYKGDPKLNSNVSGAASLKKAD